MYRSVHWKSHFLQGTRPCLICNIVGPDGGDGGHGGHVIFSSDARVSNSNNNSNNIKSNINSNNNKNIVIIINKHY